MTLILNISIASDNNIYVGSNFGVFQLDLKGPIVVLWREFQNYPELQKIFRLQAYNIQDNGFASMGNGLYTIDGNGS